MTVRTMWHEYWELTELPIGEIPYSAIQRGLKDEKYFRKFTPTHYRENLLQGHLAALLFWYPRYVDFLYEMAIDGKDYLRFFHTFAPEITEGFKYLFPELIKKLDKLKESTLKLNHLEEIKFNRSYK